MAENRLNAGNFITRTSYSQSGEDCVVDFLLEAIGVRQPTYLDIGAHDPFYLSNTALFYQKGFSGINVEPDPVLYEKIRKERTRDACLNCGVGSENRGDADFYVMSIPTLNTFSEKEARRLESSGAAKILAVLKIEVVGICEILAHLVPNFVSLDVEGMDLQILQGIDFKQFRPDVFCVETLTFTIDKNERKLDEIISHMHENDYMTYADTYINTIFVEKSRWRNRT